MTASVFQRAMFEEGLPIRGGVAFGEFVFQENVFAGKPLVYAHQVGQRLNLAACAIHATALLEFQKLLAIDPHHGTFLEVGKILVRYPAPIKQANNQIEEMETLINLAWPTLKDYPSLNGIDLRWYVHDRFLAHGKQMPLDAVPKAENTERFLRFLQSRFPDLFYR